MKKNSLSWLWLSSIWIALDQTTKYYASLHLQLNQPKAIFPSLNLTLAYNRGAAFSFLNSSGGWQQWLFGGIAIFVSLLIIVWLYKLPRSDKWTGIALSLILAGAAGNVIDRINLGYVVDFIDLYYQQWHWPVFNVADIGISLGAIIVILTMFRKPRQDVA